MSHPKIRFVSASVVVRMADGQERSIELQDDVREQLTADISVSTNEVDVSEFVRDGGAGVVMAYGQVATIHLRGSVASHVDKQTTPAPWRFDVPEVPAHVTALKDVEGYVWVRVAECWQAADDPTTEFDTFHGLVRFVEMTPLVECPDPRAAS